MSAKNIFPTLLHRHYQPESSIQGRRGPYFTLIFGPTIRMSQQEQIYQAGDVCPVFCCPPFVILLSVTSVSFYLFCLFDMSGTRCSFLLPQLICFKVRWVMRPEILFCIAQLLELSFELPLPDSLAADWKFFLFLLLTTCRSMRQLSVEILVDQQFFIY